MAESEMVERIARIIDPFGWNEAQLISVFGDENGPFVNSIKDRARARARAILEAMREPTDAMCDAWPTETAVDCWRAMINAALAHPPTSPEQGTE